MLERLLKLLGFDLDARIAALKAEVERRIAAAKQELQHIARATAMAAGFAFAGIVTALLACLVGLVALYAWIAEQYGVYAGLGAVGGLLVLLTLALLLAARSSARALGDRPPAREAPVEARSLQFEPSPPVTRPAVVSPLAEQALAASAGTASAADLVEPLAVLLSSVLGAQGGGNALLNQVLAHAELATSGATGEAIDTATALVRDGDRATMLGVLGAAGFVGYLLGDALAAHQASD
jgi:hypothetical protein